MTPERWAFLTALFDELVELDPARRAKRLAALGTTDAEARRELEAMLAAVRPRDPHGLAGSSVGHFRLLEPLGAGGTGVVYRAEDTRLQRSVAVKLPPPGAPARSHLEGPLPSRGALGGLARSPQPVPDPRRAPVVSAATASQPRPRGRQRSRPRSPVAGLYWDRPPAQRESPDPNLVAVAPFDVLDPSLGLWREGPVDILSRDLDQAGPIRTVSQSVTLRRWSGRADPVLEAYVDEAKAGLERLASSDGR